jgi:septum formation protein
MPVLGADTCIVLNGKIVGKPDDRDHGIALLKQYSGNTHQVLTGVAMVGQLKGTAEAKPEQLIRINTSHVTFCTLSDRECEQYWDSGEPMGKAGGYAIQGKAAAFIKTIEGSYSAIMGLPLYELAQLLAEFGIHWLDE